MSNRRGLHQRIVVTHKHILLIILVVFSSASIKSPILKFYNTEILMGLNSTSSQSTGPSGKEHKHLIHEQRNIWKLLVVP